jgi:glycosyltransferase involved in cell wall biosynthesis
MTEINKQQKPTLVISCPASSRSGYGNHSRDLIRSLVDIDMFNVEVIDQRWGSCPRTELIRKENADIAKLTVSGNMQKQPDVWMQVTVPNEFQPIGKYNIGVTAGIETDRVSPEWLEGMNRMDMNIVPSEHSKTGFQCYYDKKDEKDGNVVSQLSMTKPIEILFEGVDTEVYTKTSKIDSSVTSRLSSIKEDFCFLLCGHWMNGEFLHDRKDIGGTIHTFISTFMNMSERNQPALVIKTGIAFSVPEEMLVKKKISDVIDNFKNADKRIPSVYIVWGDLSDSEMNSLYNHPKIKAMVSFTHGEGYGRPLAEFSITGKPVITTNYSGHLDFIGEHGILLEGELKVVHPSVVWDGVIVDHSQWYYVNYQYASSVMKDVHKNYKAHLEKTRKQTKYMKDNFSLKNMTESFKDIMEKYTPSFTQPQDMDEFQIPKLEELQTYE